MDSGRALVFDGPTAFTPPDTRKQYFTEFRDLQPPTTRDGIVPVWSYVIRKKGVVELGFGGCSECHVRVMPDGSAVKGAQDNAPSVRASAWLNFHRGSGPDEVKALRERKGPRSFAPWAPNQDAWGEITFDEIIHRLQAMPPGVFDREGASLKHPVKAPSLIGVQDLHYLDATGLSLHRNVGDMMRYAIVNQGLMSMARYGDYLPHPSPAAGNARYSDEQLYALALYIYSLKPPASPNPIDDRAIRGQIVFNRQGCSGCHPAPLYTNNKLTPARGFTIPDALRKTEAILDVSVGTDPGLALETRRGTGFYKVPSLRGVWMRSALGHEGQAYSLEEWFDPARLKEDYVPKGFHLGPGPIQGHEFGLKLPLTDREALVAFLKTL